MQPVKISSDHPLSNLLLAHHVNNLTNGVKSPGSDDHPVPSPGFTVSTPSGVFKMFNAPSAEVPKAQPLTKRITSSFSGLFARKAEQ